MDTGEYKMSEVNKEMLVSNILYNDTNIEFSEANQIAKTIEQDFKSLNGYNLYNVGNTIACDLTEEDLLFLEAMGL